MSVVRMLILPPADVLFGYRDRSAREFEAASSVLNSQFGGVAG